MDNQLKNLSPEDLFRILAASRQPWHDNYLVMYSSLWGGFSINPEFWGVPPDDHMAHRGDAVFEYFKVVGGKVHCLPEHLKRLNHSAETMGIPLEGVLSKLPEILKEAHRLGGVDEYAVRVNVSRGPGSFTVNPRDCHGPQLYLVTMRLHLPSPETYDKGIKLITAPFPAKMAFSGIKTCDYLHNVLCKKAAVDAGGDYPVSFDTGGNLTESSTENVAVVTKGGELVAPPFNRILKGVTLSRVMDLAQSLVASGVLKAVVNRDILKKDLLSEAAEIFITSTSFDILGASHWDGNPIGDGKPGPVTRALTKLIDEEIRVTGTHSASLA
jgi:branched-chain amino acid aminotransferase